jgi:hypothetical protein
MTGNYHGLSSGALTDLKGNSTPIKSSTLGAAGYK